MIRFSPKLFLTFLISSIAICITTSSIGCKGISGSGVSQSQRFESGFRSLRIGQITTANNRVATTIAIDSRETIVVLEPAPGSASLTEVLYQSTDQFTAEILVSSDSLPNLANTDDSIVDFSDYTDENVTLDVINNGITLSTQTVALNQDIFGFFNLNKSLGRSKALAEDDLVRIFRIAVIAVRVFGCTSQSYLENTSSSLPFGELTESACSSTLITTMLNVIKVADFEKRIIDEFLGDPIGCAYEEGNFLDALNCLNNSKPEVIREALVSNPDIDSVLNGSFDPNTGEIIPEAPSPTPTPPRDSSPRPSPTPDNSIPNLPDAPIPGDPILIE